MLVSDALSLAYIKNSKLELDGLIPQVHFAISNLPISIKSLEQFNPFVPNTPFLYPFENNRKP